MPQLTTFRIYLLSLGLLFVAYVVLEYNRPKPLDWTPTYANKDKIPYGTYALYDQLPHLLGTDSVEAVRTPVYSQLTGLSAEGPDSPDAPDADDTATTQADSTATDSTATADAEPAADEPQDAASEDARYSGLPLLEKQANYLFVNDGFDISRLDAHALLQYVARGNDAFIATQTMSSACRDLLRDSLGLRWNEAELLTHAGPKGLPITDSVDVRFSNPALAAVRTRLPGTALPQRLAVDSGRVGHTLATDGRGQALFVRLNHGRGHFYICAAPVAFTNYYLLRPRGAGFAAAALSYLPARRTWWDEYQKQGPVGEQSLLRVVFANDALRAAYYLTLAGGLLFVLVAARRRQRIIPTIKPLPNTTLLFTRTVASLYRQGSSHALIAEKKVGLFLDYLRTRFQETSPDLADEDFRERLSQKSGLTRARVDELLRLVNFARTAPQVNDQQLLQLSKALSDFRREAGR